MFKVYKEWLVDDNNKTVYMTLREWAAYYGLTPVAGSSWAWMTRDGAFIDVEGRGGYGVTHADFDKYADDLFFVGNADLDRVKIRYKYF